jgi:hypothetical protein
MNIDTLVHINLGGHKFSFKYKVYDCTVEPVLKIETKAVTCMNMLK